MTTHIRRLFRTAFTLVAFGAGSQVTLAQTPVDSVVPMIERGDLSNAQRILVPLAAAGDPWAYFNLGVVHSEYARRATGKTRTSRYVESYAHFRAAELLGDSLATHDRKEAGAVLPAAQLSVADARVTALLARHGHAQLARIDVMPVPPSRSAAKTPSSPTETVATAPATATDGEAWSSRFIQIKRGAIVTPDIDWEDRVRYVRELSVRPIGREELLDILVTDVPKAVIAGSPRPAGSLFQRRVVEGPDLSYDTAVQLGELLSEVLSRSSAPSETTKQRVKDAIADVEKQKPGSALLGSLRFLVIEWSKPRPAESAPPRRSPTCMDFTPPSTGCLVQWIASLTAPETSLTGLCLKQIAGMAATGMVYDLGGRSDEEDNQLAFQVCKDGNAFVISQRYHSQLQRGAPRQFARMQEAYRIAARVKLIFF